MEQFKANLIQKISVEGGEKPSIVLLRKGEHAQMIGIGLAAGQLFPRHKTDVPATLTIFEGRVEFRWEEEKVELVQGDVFEIPVGIFHEVEAFEASRMILTKGA